MSLKHLLLVGLLAFVAACSTNKTVIDESLSESELYRKAQTDLDAENFGPAIETLRSIPMSTTPTTFAAWPPLPATGASSSAFCRWT